MYFNPFRDFLQRVLFGARTTRRGMWLRTRPRNRHLSLRHVRAFSLAAEVCEARTLLSGPQLIQVTPNTGTPIATNTTPATATVETQAPTQITLTFSPGAAIDANTLLSAISVTRPGPNGTFDGTSANSDDVNVGIGSIQVDTTNTNQVIMRFLDSLPDDSYQIHITTSLKDTIGNSFVPDQTVPNANLHPNQQD